ncbi:hypothetical protein BJ138DRAFT_1150203 [Hygrophoropsis aurantiaca]|uniref:Uncharacterized protein n=1 Tax=Hygrophoropsis aurantiaca TaxID=72124 RepID=A0ACB8ADR2_9AGAM|nr:hypothetical protein BJ138DRAFT_1150203 [Hygrophoropsis aurantiaca]
MSQPQTVTLRYELNPPTSVNAPDGLTATAEHTFPISPSNEDNAGKSATKIYYAALQTSIAEARRRAGVELSAWKDAVGSAELGKEGSKRVVDEDEGEEEEDAEA